MALAAQKGHHRPSMRLASRCLFLAPLALAACAAPPDEPCPSGTQPNDSGRCIDPSARYEPVERIDENNVVAFGEALQVLDLPDPPKSGFRLVAPPMTLGPGEEIETCLSWPYPA